MTRLFAESGTVATVPAFSYSMYPFAAAMALFPIAIMAVYLLGARALGAFEEI